MHTHFQLLPGLPLYGDLPTPFPESWGRFGREGVVVKFELANHTWCGNFRPGREGMTDVLAHPHGRHVLVIAKGDLWTVDPESGTAEYMLPCILRVWEVTDPPGFILDRQGLAMARLSAAGLVWHTRRLSWDGFAALIEFGQDHLRGLGWDAVNDSWVPFRVNLRTGASTGGAYVHVDHDEWERLASDDDAA